MNHNQAPLITGIPSQAELEQQTQDAHVAEQVSPWAPEAASTTVEGGFEDRQQAARTATSPEDPGFDYVTVSTQERAIETQSDPYLSDYERFSPDGEALRQIALTTTDETTGQVTRESGWLVVGGGTAADGQTYVKVMHPTSTPDAPREGYITNEQLAASIEADAPGRRESMEKVFKAHDAAQNQINARPEVEYDEHPTMDGAQHARLLAEVRAAQQDEQSTQRVAHDAHGRPLFRP